MRGVDRFFAHKTTFSKNASPVLKVLPPPRGGGGSLRFLSRKKKGRGVCKMNLSHVLTVTLKYIFVAVKKSLGALLEVCSLSAEGYST